MAAETIAPASVLITRRKFSAAEYHRMAEVGILTEDDRVELIEGDIVAMAPVGDHHVNVVDRMTELFVLSVAGKARVSVQNPVRLSLNSEPQPDLLILHRESFGRAGRTEDVLVLVEVSDSTGAYDRNVKLPLYARYGIPHVLNVDVPGRAVVHYAEPDEDGYRRSRRYVRGEQLRLEILPSVAVSVAVDDLFT